MPARARSRSASISARPIPSWRSRATAGRPYKIEPGTGQTDMVKLRIGGKARSPVEISAEILKTLRARAEAALEKPVERAVITVPASFDGAARTATRDAARVAGLEVLRRGN